MAIKVLIDIVTLSLDYVHESEFGVGSYGSLFHHPGLERLTIVGAQFQVRSLDESLTSFRSTRLRELALLNCDLTPRDLKNMPRYPCQLKHFTMKGQEEEASAQWLVGESNRQLYIESLRSKYSSLKPLDLDLQYNEWEDPMDLSNFSALQSLTILPQMLIGNIHVSSSSQPQL